MTQGTMFLEIGAFNLGGEDALLERCEIPSTGTKGGGAMENQLTLALQVSSNEGRQELVRRTMACVPGGVYKVDLSSIVESVARGAWTQGWEQGVRDGFIKSAPGLAEQVREAVLEAVDTAEAAQQQADGRSVVEFPPEFFDQLAQTFQNLPAPVVNNEINLIDEPTDAEIEFKRDPSGKIKSAKLTEAGAQ